MKKVVLTLAFVAGSLFAFANLSKTPSFIVNNYNSTFEQVSDSCVKLKEETFETLTLDKCVNFYDIERLVVRNKKHNRIIVVNEANEIIADTVSDLDITVPAGDYKVYSSANVKSYMRYSD